MRSRGIFIVTLEFIGQSHESSFFILALSSKLRIGTRGSPLALAQTRIVIDLLRSKVESLLDYETKIIVTEGDKISQGTSDSTQSGKDSFTRAIDRAVAAGEVDLAVHSLKDIPLENFDSKEIEIASFPRRDKPNDVLISKKGGETLSSLPNNSRVGTGSPRRAAQLLHWRPDFQVVEIRGNVQTRIEKLRKGSEFQAIVLARAGLDRLGLGNIGWDIPLDVMLPAAGQGAIAVAVRRDDSLTKSLVSKIDDEQVRECVLAEIAFTRKLEAGCRLPVAAFGTIEDSNKLALDGLVVQDGNGIRRSRIVGPLGKPESLGLELAAKLG